MVANFTVWDAPEFGVPRLDAISTQWQTGGPLITVTLARSEGSKSQALPDVIVASMNPSIDQPPRQGLTVGVLLLFIDYLVLVEGMDPQTAAEELVRLSMQPGTPTMLTMEGKPVAAHRHEILGTGAWVATSLDPKTAVCVAGSSTTATPRLEAADLKLWEGPLREQINEASADQK
jgi:hypothetical protein